MLGIFIGGLVLLAALIFAAGLLLGRDWGGNEANERAKAAQRGSANQEPVKAAAPADVRSWTGAIRPLEAPSLSVPAIPAAPAIPALPAIPAPPQAPVIPALPPLKSSSASPPAQMEVTRSPALEPMGKAAAASPAPTSTVRADSGDNKMRRYVIYVGAYANGARAEKIVEQLRSRNLAAQTGSVDQPGQQHLVSVWVGPFDARSKAQAALPELRAAGLEDTMIRAVRNH